MGGGVIEKGSGSRMRQIKGTISVISSDPPWKDRPCPISNGTLETLI